MIVTANDARKNIRSGNFNGPTSGLAKGYTQANLVILPYKYAFDFFLFCYRNKKACPILDICEAGNYNPVNLATNGDIRTDIPKYRIYKNGVLEKEVSDIVDLWSSNFVSFLIGCSFTFENALIQEEISIRHIEENKNVPMYITNIECIPGGIFNGNLVVSMRPIHKNLVQKAVSITSRFPKVHGAPVHIGDPAQIGIKNINKTDFGDIVTINKDELPVFWACGVTTQVAIMNAKPELVITHAPGHMFITDVLDNKLMKEII